MELWGYPLGDLYLWKATMVPALQHRGNKGTGQDLFWGKADNRDHRAGIACSVQRAGLWREQSGCRKNQEENLSGGKIVTKENGYNCQKSMNWKSKWRHESGFCLFCYT